MIERQFSFKNQQKGILKEQSSLIKKLDLIKIKKLVEECDSKKRWLETKIDRIDTRM